MACVESVVYLRKRGRVVECTGLENRRWATIREFESHLLRQILKEPLRNQGFFFA